MLDSIKEMIKVYLLPNRNELYYKQAKDTVKAANSFAQYIESDECKLDHQSVKDCLESPEKFIENLLK